MVSFMFASLFKNEKGAEPVPHALQVGSRTVPLLIVRNPRARRYLLRLRPDGAVRITIPPRGTISAGKEFALRNAGWLERQFQLLARQPKTPLIWNIGMEILFRGEPVHIESQADGSISFGPERVRISDPTADLRPAIEKHLRRLAALELPARVLELAAHHGVMVSRVSVRNQKTRWGSCSVRGTISLNWRLIHAPGFVRDYIILHELAHRSQMNHSKRFWHEVARMCPDYRLAEQWLKQRGRCLAGSV
jgi:predicted metal-dependent hydrolase